MKVGGSPDWSGLVYQSRSGLSVDSASTQGGGLPIVRAWGTAGWGRVTASTRYPHGGAGLD